MGAAAVPLCQTCRLWGQGSCRQHQGRRGCPGCGGTGRVRFMQVGLGGLVEAEMSCPCVEEK